MSDFEQILNKMRQRAVSYCAITCGNVGILIKIYTITCGNVGFLTNFEQNAPKGRKYGAITCGNVGIFIKILNKMRQRAASYSAITCRNVGF
jgi:roadblock/LC7 domain-containing protein